MVWLAFMGWGGDWNAKVGVQETRGITGKFGLGIRNEAGQRLIQFCQENTLVIAHTVFQQHKRRLYTWTSPGGQHQNQTDYILCSQRCKALYSQQKQDRELTVAQIMNSISHFHCLIIRNVIKVIPEWSSGFPHFLQFKSEFGNKDFMI